MSTVRIRNYSYIPKLQDEGAFVCPMPAPSPVDVNTIWYANLTPHQRLFFHQTLSSVRQSKRFRQRPLIPKDSLDFQLQSRYNHSKESFPEKIDMILQRETCSRRDTFRLLRNTRVIRIIPALAMGHPLQIGGCTEKISPHSVKLINSGPHTQLVNNGFSRQPADGNFFRY